MTAKRKSSANNYVPSSYEDLYVYYIADKSKSNRSLCTQIIRKFMPYVNEDELETLRHDVFLRLMEKDMLNKFDPAKSNFGGVVYFVARTICVNHMGKKGRNPITGLNGGTLSNADPEDEVFEPGVYNLDRIFGSDAPNYEEQLHTSRILDQLFAWAQEREAIGKNKRDKSLHSLLLQMKDQWDPKESASALEVTPSTIWNWVEVIRRKAREIQQELAPVGLGS